MELAARRQVDARSMSGTPRGPSQEHPRENSAADPLTGFLFVAAARHDIRSCRLHAQTAAPSQPSADPPLPLPWAVVGRSHDERQAPRDRRHRQGERCADWFASGGSGRPDDGRQVRPIDRLGLEQQADNLVEGLTVAAKQSDGRGLGLPQQPGLATSSSMERCVSSALGRPTTP